MKKLTKKKVSSYGNPSQAALDWYLAGIIDGEGCIAVQKSKNGLENNPLFSARVCVGMVDKHICELFQREFGGSVREERVPDRRSIYRWRLQDKKNSLKFIERMEGKLKVKQNQLELISEFHSGRISNPVNKRYLCEEELQRREGLYLKSRELNAVGAGATTKRLDIREDEAIV